MRNFQKRSVSYPMRSAILWLSAFLGYFTLIGVPSASAQFREQVGYNQLLAERGGSLETGAGVSVAVAEAFVSGNYLPNFNDPEFAGKNLFDASGIQSGISSHANSVTRQLVGNSTSISSGVTDVTIYQADDWINRVLGMDTGNDPQLPTYKIQNNSWIGSFTDNAVAVDLLNRVDYVVNQSDVLMLGGTANSNSGVPDALGHGYNTMIVGRTSGGHGSGLTTFNGAGRVKPDIVAPAGTSSIATPMVGTAAAILHQAGAGTDATRSETMRAILMAGATKDEFANWDRTVTRPLDEVFGAGELNIYNSYNILQAGEFDPSILQPTFSVGLTGWSYVEEINPGDTFYYNFEVASGFKADELSISLNWNLNVTDLNPEANVFDPFAELANLDMRLFDSTNTFLDGLVDASLSPVDNVEHIYLRDLQAGTYTLAIQSNGKTDYGLAWRSSLSAVPEPGTWLVLSIAGAAIVCRRHCKATARRK